MISLSLALFVIGLSDLTFGGLAATPKRTSWISLIGLIFLLSTAASFLYWLNTSSAYGGVFLFLTTWIGSCVWVLARTTNHAKWQIVAVGSLFLTIAVTAFVIPVIAQETPINWLSQHLNNAPWESLSGIEPGKLVLVVSVVIFLGPTSNGIVRSCLMIVRETPVTESEKTLKGGRFIGPLERFLIFGLALAGQPTAAALIISAKSIIRFPELQSKGRFPELQSKGQDAVQEIADPVQDRESTGHEPTLSSPSIDELTEYFLLGSLMSWSLALAAALPFH